MLWETDQTEAAASYAASGSLAAWRANVAQRVAVHPLAVAALCQGLVGPILDLCADADGFGIHLFGKSSKGKTTAANIAASIWGPPKVFGRTWKTTVAGLELVAAAHNEVVVILDELNQCGDPEKAGEVIYMLTGGQGKSRSNRQIELRSLKTWAVPYLSTGEYSTRDYISSAPFGAKATAGQNVRCLDLRLSEETGIFRDGSEAENAALATSLKSAAKEYYGTAGIAFLKQVVADREKTRSDIAVLREEFRADPYIRQLMARNPDGQVVRVKDEQVSILYAAGVLASRFSILPFTEQQVRDAALLVLDLWVDQRGTIGAHEDHEAEEKIRGYIQMNEHRFIRIVEQGDGEVGKQFRPNNPIGYCLKDLYALFSAAWETEACAGLDRRQVAQKLFALNYLDAETTRKGGVRKFRKAARYIMVEGRKESLVCIRQTIRGKSQSDESGDLGVFMPGDNGKNR